MSCGIFSIAWLRHRKDCDLPRTACTVLRGLHNAVKALTLWRPLLPYGNSGRQRVKCAFMLFRLRWFPCGEGEAHYRIACFHLSLIFFLWYCCKGVLRFRGAVLLHGTTETLYSGSQTTAFGGMEGWVDLSDLITHRPGVEPATVGSKVWRANRCATKTPSWESPTLQWQRWMMMT